MRFRIVVALPCTLLLAKLSVAARVANTFQQEEERVANTFQEVSWGEEEGAVPPHVFAAARNARRRQEEARRRREAQRRMEERKRREEYLRKERHKRENLQDCRYKEDWELVQGSCTAKCGGGVETIVLRSREVVTPRDTYGYGKECPPPCTDSDKSGCGERRQQSCATKPCLMDCSTIDLGNPVVGVGVPIAWNYTRTRETEECVFQFWRVLSKSPFRAQLVAETNPREGNREVYGIRAMMEGYWAGVMEGHRGIFRLNSGDEGELVLGFRGCSLQVGADGREPASSFGLPPGTARTCVPGQDMYRLSAQQHANPSVARFLGLLARESRKNTQGVPELWSQASAEDGLSMPANLPTETLTQKAFPFSVTMAPDAPPMKVPKFVHEGNDVVGLLSNLDADNGAAVHSARINVRPLFYNGNSQCDWTTLPPCGELPGEASLPCMLMAVGDGGVGKVTLRNFPMARMYEVSVRMESMGGVSEPWVSHFATTATPGRSDKKCTVSHWACSDEDDVKDVLPAASEEGCSLTGSPLPMCLVTNKFEAVTQRPKCFGKRYWQECAPVVVQGEPDCVNITAVLGQPTAMQVCSHHDKLNEEKCEARGCGKSFFPWNTKTCCCSPSIGADSEEDSPGCACVVAGTCESLGLVAAADPKKSCRH